MAFGLSDILGLLGAGTAGGATGAAGYGFGKALGGGLGGGSGFGKGLSEFFMGTPREQQRYELFTPEQQSAQSQTLQQGLENTNFSGIEDLARKRFQEDTIPTIAERFTGMGAGGQRSSAFQGALGRAGSDLETQLGGLRSQYGMQQLGMGMQPSFGTAFQQASPGAGRDIMQMLPMLLSLLVGGR